MILLKPKISVVINTYNAEKHLQTVLETVKDFDEVVVCDMHSTDRTIAIAEQYGCKIVYHERLSYVEPARNYAIQSATNEWVLLIDADEIVPTTLKDELLRRLQTEEFDALAVPRKNYFMGRFMRSTFPDYNIRFFKKSKVNWLPAIHSTPTIDGKLLYLKKDKRFALEHLANDSFTDVLRKIQLYTDAELLRRKPKRVSLFKFVCAPMIAFCKTYFIKGGFLDGKEGYLYAKIDAYYKFFMLAKLNEAYHQAHQNV